MECPTDLALLWFYEFSTHNLSPIQDMSYVLSMLILASSINSLYTFLKLHTQRITHHNHNLDLFDEWPPHTERCQQRSLQICHQCLTI